MDNITKTISIFAILLLVNSVAYSQTEFTTMAECSITYANGKTVYKCVGIKLSETECRGYACGNISDYEISLKIASEIGVRLDDGKVEKFIWNGNENTSIKFEFKSRF